MRARPALEAGKLTVADSPAQLQWFLNQLAQMFSPTLLEFANTNNPVRHCARDVRFIEITKDREVPHRPNGYY